MRWYGETHPATMPYFALTRFCRALRQTLRAITAGSPKLPLWLGLARLLASPAWANLPGGGDGTGPAVTLVNSGNGTITMANGLISILCNTNSGTISQINYTYNNSGSTVTSQLLAGGANGGQMYWFGTAAVFGTGTFTYSVVANTTNYCEINLISTSATNGVMEVHYSMLRGSPGFYVTPILIHRSVDTAFSIGQLRPNIYAGSTFNWMSVDAARNRLMEVSGGQSVVVRGSPVENYLWTNGIYAGQYEDKYKYTADFGTERVWGWSSVGSGGKNVGIWNISASVECYPGGPMERDLMEHIGTTILNVFTGGYYGLGSDDTIGTGEVWTKVYGPYFIYCNNVTNSLTAMPQAAQALYGDALAQQVAEQSAWPYAWFNHPNYAPATNRGTVTGKMVISDSGNPNASAGGLWVGLVQQPLTSTGSYDFQQWAKPYQFWVKTDANGNFSIPDVIAGTNYTLYAFGPGAAATFMSQSQTGGSPPLLYDVPATPFSITVTNVGTNNLGTVTWTPARVGATVFEIGYPDRTGQKFRHGDDYWVGDIGPSPTAPSPIWSKWLEYPFDFPSGPNYLVGSSRWSTDWNFIQPVVTDSQGNYNASASTITFNLPAAPTNGAQASLYLGLSSDYYTAIVVSVNGNNLANVSGVTGSPNNSIPSTGYYVGYGGSDTSIREGNNGAFSDERLTFPATQLHAGVNTINIAIRQIAGSYFANHCMYDYVRLELGGYVPPPPASVTAFAGNNANLVSWPATPGATSYNLLRSTSINGTYASITNGVIGAACGSGSNNVVYLDATAANGTTYYYAVRSVNPTGSSTNSPVSAGVTPSVAGATNIPAAPTGLVVAGTGHQSVTLNWTASAGASFYSVWRSTLVSSGGGSSNTLSTILLGNTNTATTYTDTSPTDGTIYSYFVTATGPGGTSANSTLVATRALPPVPAILPVSLTASFVQTTNITLNWTAVPGAVGYAIYRATSAAGPFMFLQTITETTYTDYGLSTNIIYYYRVTAVNAAGISAYATDSVNSQQVAPTSLAAVGTNAQVILTWSATTGATSYTVKRGTSPGNETNTVITGYAGTSYTNASLINGTTYYYIVTATGAGGTSGNSPEASATASASGNGTWIASTGGNWSNGANWSGDLLAYGSGYTADFSTLSLATDATVILDSARTVSGLKFGDTAASHNWFLTGTNTLTLGTAPNINVVNQSATISTPVAGTAGLTKTGTGTLILGGATETVTGGTTINGGTLTLDFSVTGSPATNLLPAANTLVLGGGNLTLNGVSGGNLSQSFASTALNPGGSVINLNGNGANALTNTLGALTATVGGTVEFIGPATMNASGNVAATGTNLTTTAGTGSLGCLGGFGVGQNGAWATVGLYDWASTDLPGGTAGSPPYTIIGGSQVNGFYQTTGLTTGGNYDVNPSGVNSMGNAGGAATIRFNNSKAASISFTATTAQNLQGILVTPNMGSTNATISGGGLEFIRSTSGGNCYGVIWQNNPKAWLNFSTIIEGGRQAGQNNGLVQAGPGTVVYSGSGGNNYELGTWLNGGYSVVTANNDFGLAGNAATVTLNGGTVVGNGTFTMDNAGANLRPFTLLGNGGGLAATAGTTMTIDGVIGSAAGAGPLVIGIPASAANGNVSGLLPGSGTNTANLTGVYAIGTVGLANANYYTGGTILQSGTLNINGINALGGANYGGLTLNGGTLQYAANFPGTNGSADLTGTGSGSVTLAPGGGTIDLNGNAITYAGSIGNNGPGALVIKSSLPNAQLALAGANTYTGITTLTNATLLVSNLTGSATGAGNVTVQNGAVLKGGGALAGAVTVAPGGTLSPGNPWGTLVIGGNLTLAAGSTTLVQIQSTPATNGFVTVGGSLVAGGTLVVTNRGGTALTAGNVFKLLSAASYAGSFGNVSLPALNPGLFWSTSRLAVDGTLGVVSTSPPAVNSVVAAGNSLVLQGTGGTPNWAYTVLASTNLALPLAQWTATGTNFFDAVGNFAWTNTASLSAGPQFYVIRVQ